MPSTPIMTSCGLRCSCGWSGKGTYYYQDMDAHKNVFPCPTCEKECILSFGGKVAPTPTFPFTTKHVDGLGTEITINNLRELQAAEKKYGGAFMHNSEESHTGELPRHRPGGVDFAEVDDGGSARFFGKNRLQ